MPGGFLPAGNRHVLQLLAPARVLGIFDMTYSKTHKTFSSRVTDEGETSRFAHDLHQRALELPPIFSSSTR